MVKWVQLLISEELLPVRWRLGEKVVREEGRLVLKEVPNDRDHKLAYEMRFTDAMNRYFSAVPE